MGSKTLPIYLNQAIISGGNFVAGLFLVRTLGLEQFGQYSILFVVALFISTTHNALFSAPMFTIAPVFSKPARKAYMANLNLLQLLAGLIALICIAPISLLIGRWWPQLSESAWWFAAACACIPLQEWQRRYLIASGKLLDSVIYDGFRITAWLALLFIHQMQGNLTVTTALQSLALSSGLVYLMSFFGATPGLSRSAMVATAARNWAHARHLMPSYQLEWAGLQGFLIVAGALLGAQAAGAIRAAQNILGPLNIAYQAADSIFPTRGAHLLAARGHAATRDYFSRVARHGLILLAIPCGLIALYADEVIVLVYGDEMAAYGSLVAWQSASLLIGFSLKLLSAYLRILGATRAILLSTLLGVSTTYLLIFPLGNTMLADGILLAKVLAEILAVGYAVHALSLAMKTGRAGRLR